MGLKTYLYHLAIAVDVVINVLIGGTIGETLSSTSYRKHRDHGFWGFLEPVINTIMFNKNHCWEAYLTDRSRIYLK